MSKQLGENHKKAGILYLEDFEEAPAEKSIKVEETYISSVDEKESLISSEILDDFYKKGVLEGRKIEEEKYDEYKKKIEKSNELLLNMFSSIEKQFFLKKNQISQDLHLVVSNSLLNLFPSLITKYGENESEEVLKKIFEFIDQNLNISINCSKEFFDKINNSLLSGSKRRITFNLDETLKNGDFELLWDTGSLSRNANERIGKIVSEIFLTI
ncbi:hypothetical protein HKD21_09120 [Gluconobacter cerevisiae]|uniref:Flagellar assembly protein FliH/Type III secretion system HrpE domain-containing protein n=1 Tax=Gluconobacter cerevisiae TaxID=1379734 RepID=A0ABR9YFB4_9PROT|nr:hypothetical protein [Gluconobacter cerevisiae]MBF0877009.1 hypothetical protein [Gluconobacter cerevisiae]